MQPTERSQTVAFLLSLSAIPLGCPAEEDDGFGTNATTASGSLSSAITTTVGTDSTGDETDESGVTPASTTTSSSTTDTAETSANATEADTGEPYGYGLGCQYNNNGFDVPELCTLYAERTIECLSRDYAGMEAIFEQYCGCTFHYAPMVGPGCAMANEDYYACLSTLPCGENCSAEYMAWTTACGG